MATIDVQESWQDQGLSLSSTDGITGETRITRSFTWVSSDPISSLKQVADAPGSPKIGQSHPAIFFARVRDLSYTQEGPSYGKITAEYEVPSFDPETGDNPLLTPPDIVWDTIQTEEPIDEDIYGRGIRTVNGEPIDGVTETVFDLTVSVTRNLATFNPAAIYLFLNKVNSGPFLGFPPGVALCSAIQASSVADGDFNYFRVTVQFIFRTPYRTAPERAWFKRLRHEGTLVREEIEAELETTKEVIRRAVDDDGLPVTQPVPLDERGFEIVAPTPPVGGYDPENIPPELEGVFLEFQTKFAVDFNQLGLLGG
jgi:hypothetical protein